MKIKQESFSIVFISYRICNFLLYLRDYPGWVGKGDFCSEEALALTAETKESSIDMNNLLLLAL